MRRRSLHASLGLLAASTLSAGSAVRASSPQAVAITEVDWAGGAVTAVAVDGDVGYAGVGRSLVAMRGLPGAITVEAVARPLPAIVESMAAGSGRVAVKMGDPSGDIDVWALAGSTMTRRSRIAAGELGTPFHGFDLAPDGNEVLAVANGELQLWDVRAATGALRSSLGGFRGRPAASTAMAAVGDGGGGLAIVTSEAGTLRRLGGTGGPDLDEAQLPASGRALGLARGEPPTGQVVGYDVADPLAVAETARMPLAGGAAFSAAGTEAVSAEPARGVIRTFAGAGPLPLPQGVVTASVPLAVAQGSGFALVGAMEGAYLVDSSAPETPVLVPGPALGAGAAADVAWRDDVAFAAHGAGIAAYDTSDTMTPVGALPRPGPSAGLLNQLLHGGRALALGTGGALYAAYGESGVVAYDAANADRLREAGSVTRDALGGAASALSWAAGTLYVGTDNGIAWLDTTDPLRPVVEGSAGLGGSVSSVAATSRRVLAVGGSRLYVASVSGGGPTTFRLHPEIERAEAVAADGAFGLVVSGAKLYVLDLSTEAEAPPITQQAELSDPGLDVEYRSGSYAWVVVTGAVTAVDVRSGQIVATAATVGEPARGLDVSGPDALLALGSAGIVRYHASAPPPPGPEHSVFLPRTLTEH